MNDSWTFLTNHAHVMLCLAAGSELTMREVAGKVGITERAVQKIVAELVASEYLVKERQGRRNVYELVPGRPLRHSLESHRTVEDLLKALQGTE